MTDLTPNNLSHLSDEEFIALCPQGYHAPGAEPLSPAAEALLDAYFTHADLLNREVSHEEMIAAALRALAVRIKGADAIRRDILDIATELEGTNGPV
jgi:hypothetical protein